MNRLLYGLLVGVSILFIVFFSVYFGFNAFIMKSEISKVDKYKLIKEEKPTVDFKYDKYHYVITSYKKKDMKYSTNNFLLKYLGNYYYLDSFTDCDMSTYTKDNFMYVHCINYTGNVVKFKFYGTRVFNEIIELSYYKTPNIDQKNINISKTTDKFIYIKSNKVDKSIKEGKEVKCSLESLQCEYIENIKKKKKKKDNKNNKINSVDNNLKFDKERVFKFK